MCYLDFFDFVDGYNADSGAKMEGKSRLGSMGLSRDENGKCRKGFLLGFYSLASLKASPFIAFYFLKGKILFGIFFEMSLKFNSSITIGGMVSPSKKPQGFRGSIRSKMSLMMAVSGIERNIPGMPHKAAPAITAIILVSALSFTFDPTILGTM